MEADENSLAYHQGHDKKRDYAHIVLVPVGELGAVDVMVGRVDDALNEPDQYGHSAVN